MSVSLFHKKTFAAGFTGTHVIKVSPGRQIQIGIKDKGAGGIFNVITYMAREDEEPTREKWTAETNQTGEYFETSTGGFVEIGVEVTDPSSGDIVMEVREFKLG